MRAVRGVIRQIVSGGQTGADRAALDFAIEQGIPHGGWCPRGRLAEDGAMPARYLLRETPDADYAQRTQWNVRDSDGTVVFTLAAELAGGSRLTAEFAKQLGKPWLHLHPAAGNDEQLARRLLSFIEQHGVQTLNVAGPRASGEPEIGAFVKRVLAAALLRGGTAASADGAKAPSRTRWRKRTPGKMER